jgi:hypothetical protein
MGGDGNVVISVSCFTCRWNKPQFWDAVCLPCKDLSAWEPLI